MNETQNLTRVPAPPTLLLQAAGAKPGPIARFGPGYATFCRETDQVVSCDLEGRVVHIISGSEAFRRGLDGTLVKRSHRSGRWVSERLETEAGTRPILERAFELVRLVASSDSACTVDTARRISRWLASRSIRGPGDLERDARAYRRAYGRVAILPPDQYRALMLRVVTGCPWRRCQFCELYVDSGYRLSSRAEFDDHVEQILAYLGRGIRYRTSVFLGDASLSRLSAAEIAARIEILQSRLPGGAKGAAGQIYAFADAFTPHAWSVADLRALRTLGLRRLYIGVESGSQEVLDLAGKPQTGEQVRMLVSRLEEAGISSGCIVIPGLAPRPFAQKHLEETAALLRLLPLTQRDIVYLSPFIQHSRGRNGLGFELGLSDPASIATEEDALHKSLADDRQAKGYRIARYDLREFVY